jgi:hypothetical protein
MAKAIQRKKRYTMSDLKKLFGPDYRMPTDEEMISAASSKHVGLQEILTELKQQPLTQEKKRKPTQELTQVRRELQKLLGRLEKIEKNLIAH